MDDFEKIAERFAKLSEMIDNLEAVTKENKRNVEDMIKDISEDKEEKTVKTIRQDILKSAENCVCGRREEDYGSPENNFSNIAKLWSVYLFGDDHSLSPSSVACMMILLKIARLRSGQGTKDCWIDIAGYAACGGEVDRFENMLRDRLDAADDIAQIDLPNARFNTTED